MANKIQFLRGLLSMVKNTKVEVAEPIFASDSNQLFIGGGDGKQHEVAMQSKVDTLLQNKANKGLPALLPLNFLSPYTGYGYYQKGDNGLVTVHFTVTSGFSNIATSFALLPAGFVPPTNIPLGASAIQVEGSSYGSENCAYTFIYGKDSSEAGVIRAHLRSASTTAAIMGCFSFYAAD